jgi:hypothetical protein
MDNEAVNKIKPKRKKWKIVLFSIVVFLIIIRLALPYVILKFVNKSLGNIKEYYGHVEDIDLALIRGAYKINNLKLVKMDSVTHQQDSIPFFTTPEIDLSVEWKSLFKGNIVGEVELEKPILNFVKGKHKDENVKADTTDFSQVLKKLMPLTINHFRINNGQIHFVDPYSSPQVNIPITNIQVQADNLSNVNDSNKVLPASVKATGNIYDGNFNLFVKLNPLEKEPTFDLNAGIDNVDMVNLNNFFQAYGKFKVEKGNFGLYTEFAAKDNAFNGYVKPLIRDMKIAKEGNLGQIAWENVLSGVKEIFENQKKEQVATKLPINGRFENPKTGLWTAISYVLQNAFVFALRPSVDNTIDIGKVEAPQQKKTLLQKVFGKEKERKKIDENKQ